MKTKVKNSNMFRLTVSLYTKKVVGHTFKNTHTYDNVKSKGDAMKLLWALHANTEDTTHSMSRKIIKATYNGQPFVPFS